MPVSPSSATVILFPNLTASGFLGLGVPKLSQGLGVGISSWLQKVQVSTLDVGTLGVGKGVPVPVIVAPQLLQLNLYAGFVGQNILGLMAPLFITGLANGISQIFLAALTNTTHPAVGLGSGVARFSAPPAFSDIKIGLDSVGSSGDAAVKVARAIGQALGSTLILVTQVQPIVGPPNISPGAGPGQGNLI
jgi:hypothetical protein